jgi:hypothetical protein
LHFFDFLSLYTKINPSRFESLNESFSQFFFF